tara:strand:+ start:3484 stop:4488 length:1005 start_codon:yes stop_codon:yes gene_type:complete
MKIFISIASYQDKLLPVTIHSAYSAAKYKDNLSFGIVDQSEYKLDFSKSKIASQITYTHLDPEAARGPCWARSLAQTLIKDEDYFLQVDSHTIFEKDWDDYLLSYIKTIKKSYSKPVISAYPRGFEVVDFKNKIFRKSQENDSSTHVMVLDKNKVFKDGYFSMQKGLPTQSKQIYKGFLLSAGFLFSTKEFVDSVPYDPHLYFEGEETILALRSFTKGFDIFHIPKIPLFHCYVNNSEQFSRPMHWNEEEDKNRTVKWTELQNKSKQRIEEIIMGKLTDSFGLGSKRTLNDYKEFCGIDIKNKKILDPDNAFKFKKLLEKDWANKLNQKKGFLW